jgi:ribosomal protein S18 acetylase RimI-like enzyme
VARPSDPSLGRYLASVALKAATAPYAIRAPAHMDVGTSEDDTAARGLYESLGFDNYEGRYA